MNSNRIKDFIWNTIGVTMNAFLSLFFLIIVKRVNGMDLAGTFTFAFAFSNVASTIALYYGRIFQVTDSKGQFKEDAYVYTRLLTCLAAFLFGLGYSLINQYDVTKTVLILLLTGLRCVEAMCDVFHGVIQQNNKLHLVGKSLFFRSLCALGVFVLTDILTRNLWFSCLSLVLVYCCFLIFCDYHLVKKERIEKYVFRKEDVWKLLKVSFFTFAFSVLSMYLVNSQKFVIDQLLDNESQVIYGIIIMPATIVILMNQFFVQPILNDMTKFYQKKDYKSFLKLIYKVVGIIICICILAIIVASFLGIPVLNFIYNIDLTNQRLNLLLIIGAAGLTAIASTLSSCLTLMRKTGIQVIIYTVVCIIATGFAYLLIRKLGFNGSVYSYCFMMVILLLLYIFFFTYYLKKERKEEKK